MSLCIVWKQHQLRNEEAVVEPDEQHRAYAEPAHRVHHEMQSQLHLSGVYVAGQAAPNHRQNADVTSAVARITT